MYLTVNDKPVVTASIALPRQGVWHADVLVDDDTPPAKGAVQTIRIADGEIALKGSVFRSGLHRGAVFTRIVGGAGGLSKEIPAKGYNRTPMNVPLVDIAREAGEKLSPSIDRSLLTRQLPAWGRAKQVAAAALTSLLAVLGVGWRVLGDGSIWLGAESWPASSMDYDLLEDAPDVGRSLISADIPSVVPGQTLGGRKVSNVLHEFNSRALRTSIWWEA